MLRGRAAFFAVAALSAMGMFYFVRDLNLSNIELPTKLPDVVVENLNFRRTMDDRDWHITAVSAEHISGVVRAVSIDLNMKSEQKAQSAMMHAAAAEFSEASGEVRMREVDGRIFLKGRSIDVRTASAFYYRSSDVWQFKDGAEFCDGEIFLKGGEAEFTGDGVFSLRKGAYARWKIK